LHNTLFCTKSCLLEAVTKVMLASRLPDFPFISAGHWTMVACCRHDTS